MVNEEFLAKLNQFTTSCCLYHALEDVDPSVPDFDQSLLSTLLTLKKILSRISDEAIDFICTLM